MRTIIFIFALAAIAACGNNTVDADPFATMQACFDEHHVNQGLSVNDAIVVCCLDHPLGTAMTHPSCGNDMATCVAYLGTDPVGTLTAASATPTEIAAACMDYITKKGM